MVLKSIYMFLFLLVLQQFSEALSSMGQDRRNLLKTLSTLVSSSPFFVMPELAFASYIDPKMGTMLPDEGEISASVPLDWGGVEDPLAGTDIKELFTRLDKASDKEFYKEPRLVEHIDENCVTLLTDFISSDKILKRGDSVLDLCSSWTSHIDDAKGRELKRLSGLGMNSFELVSNKVLTDWTVKDLNENPKLPYDDSSFNVVLCQLSIDYLTRPLDVMKEVGRVLVPGGRVYVFFSNRLFLQKAVALWTGADDIDHAYTVACYLHFSDVGFQNIAAQDLSTRRKGKIVGDPLYAVSATKM
mmetsp:Transcript_30077/g.45587  ORF Transcript_30077/g.45587 Transcript_30077/m.45587 type:complete len:301 (-) Transcript_30077:750-1652(-)